MRDSLRNLASKAAPGPWFYRPVKHDDWGTVRCSPDAEGYSPFVANVRSGSWTTDDEMAAHCRNGTDPFGDNAKFIAACDPQTILALLNENDRLRKALYAAEAGAIAAARLAQNEGAL